jgi:hypothetical protein
MGQDTNISDLTREQLEQEYRDVNFKLQTYRWLEEEIEKLDKYVERLKSEENYWWPREGRIEQVRSAIGYFRGQRDSAYRVLAALIEHCVISLRAIHMIAKSTYGMTHRQKNARMDVLCDTIGEAIQNLMQDKDRDPQYFCHEPFSRKDWDFRKLAGENYRMTREIKCLKKKLEELESEAEPCGNGDGGNRKEAPDQEIDF